MLESLNGVNRGVIDNNLIPHYLHDSFGDLYELVGQTGENLRIARRSPDKRHIIVAHQSRSVNVSPPNSDGGIVSKFIPIDNEKKYRLCVWLKKSKTEQNIGRVYFGISAANSEPTIATGGSSPNHIRFLGTGTADASNPYFFYGPMPEEYQDEWLLMVSHIRGNSDSTADATPETGVYRADGTKLPSGVFSTNPSTIWEEFRFAPLNQYIALRSFMYYSSDTNEFMETAAPRIDLIDGTQIPVSQLIADFNHRNLAKKGVQGYKRIEKQFEGHTAFVGTTLPNTSAGLVGHPSGVVYLSSGQVEERYFFLYRDLVLTEATDITILANATDGAIALMVNDVVANSLSDSSGNLYSLEPAKFTINLQPGAYRFSLFCCSTDVLKVAATIKRSVDNVILAATTVADKNNWKIKR